jgi:hypothetical protein
MLGSGCEMVWLRMDRAPPLPPEVGKEGVERATKRTVEARAMTLVGVGASVEVVLSGSDLRSGPDGWRGAEFLC